MLLATQYYRPPFPRRDYWRDDLRQIRDAGLDAVYLWATWAWIEPEPGRYVYDDFDEIVDEAARNDLDVIMTTGTELHPYWIHRVVPDSGYVDHRAQRVVSSTLSYSNTGLAPGGCWDHPGVAERIGMFQEDVGRHFAGAANLLAWDCWNEFRGPVQSDGFVCHCEHTQRAFREWLADKYGDLAGLNAAWQQRFSDWDDVRVPKLPKRSWTEMIEYQQFLEWRSAEHLSVRAARIRDGDPSHPVLAHSVVLSPVMVGGESEYEQALCRGNDWEMATRLDAFGISNFPAWFHTDVPEYGMRVECGRSAAGERPFWICELQGGAARNGLGVMDPVPADLQQSWIWAGYGRGAKAVSFWCWRDEVFGRESSGFGVIGDDGHAADRREALRHTTSVLEEHAELLDAYRPEPARVAVLFEPVNHQLDWAANGNPCTSSKDSITGYLLGLERLQIPYDVLAASHLPALDSYRVILMPWTMIVRPEVGDALVPWVRAGGTLLVETELDAYDRLGFYRYPDERPFAAALGIRGAGRRPIGTETVLPFKLDDVHGELRPATWLEPIDAADAGEQAATSSHGAVLLRRALGAGTVVASGTHLGLAYRQERYAGFESLLHALVAGADALPVLRCSAADGQLVQWRVGPSGTDRLLFVTNHGPNVQARFTANRKAFGPVRVAVDLLSGRTAEVADDADDVVLTLSLATGQSSVVHLPAVD